MRGTRSASRRRWVRLAAPAALIAGLPFVGMPWGHAEGDASRPAQWASESYASAVHVGANPVPTPFVSEVGRADFPEGHSSWNAGDQITAQASSYYPGVGVTGGGALVCSAGAPCPAGFPPPFPTVADAQYPQQPDATTATGQEIGDDSSPLHVSLGAARAHAGQDHTDTTATDTGLTIGGSSASAAAVLSFRREAAVLLHGPMAATSVRPAASDSTLVRVDSMAATTSQAFTSDGILVSTADSVLHGVHLLGGTVSISEIVTHSEAQVDGTKVSKNDSTTKIGDVLVAGQPATISEQGITVGSNPPQGSTVIQALNDAFQKALQQAGAQVALLSATKTTNSGAEGQSSTGDAGGIVVLGKAENASIPGPVNAVEMVVQLGQAGTIARASASEPGGSTDLTDTSGVGVAGVGATGTDLGSAPPAEVTSGSTAAPSTTSRTKPAAGKSSTVALGRSLPASLTGGPVVSGVRVLYLTMTLVCLGLSLGSNALRNRMFGRARRAGQP